LYGFIEVRWVSGYPESGAERATEVCQPLGKFWMI